MPQFVIIAKDGTDAEALQRRMAARDAHLANVEKHFTFIKMGGATLDEQGTMNGSIIIADFPTREALDSWLAADPYVTSKVWQDITILPYKIAPHFMR